MEVKRKTDNYLAHHGIKGQRWGVRRYQNSDGSLTDAGRKRYGYAESVENRVKNASSKKEQTYIIRSEMRKNAMSPSKKVLGSIGMTAAEMGVGTALTVAGLKTGAATLATAAIGTFAAMPVTVAAGVVLAAGSAYAAAKKNVKLADIADKYDIEDVKVRSSHQSS